MDREELKEKCDITKIEERTFLDVSNKEYKEDYIVDNDGNAIIQVPPLLFKMIEKILDLEARIKVLEAK